MLPSRAPRCSVIVPAFNASGTILRAIASIQAQTDPDFEVIIVNDGSTDDTAAKIQNSISDARVKVINSSTNLGAAAARNTALHAAQGRFVAFLDADDVWLPTKLETQMAAMALTKAEFCYSSFVRRNRNRDIQVRVPNTITYAELLMGNVIGCLTAIYDTKRLGKVAMPPLKRRQDYALWLKLLKRMPFAVGVEEVLAIHHRQERSLSSDVMKSAKGTYDVFRRAEKLSRLRSVHCVTCHYANRFQALR